jgi:hypothetical protein
MTTLAIRKGNTNKVTNNFTEKEIFDASFGTQNINGFDISKNVVEAWQIVRDYFGVPIKLTATYRTKEWDISKGRSGNGQHPKRTAIDGAFLGSNAEETQLKFHAEIEQKGELYKALRQKGVTGIGLYDNFNHLDTRVEEGKQKDEFGSYAFWDSRATTKKKS